MDRDSAYRELHDLVVRGLATVSGEGAATTYRMAEGLTSAGAVMTPLDRLKERMASAGFLTNPDYREAFGASASVAAKALARWVRAGVLIREGERRGARYVPGQGWPP